MVLANTAAVLYLHSHRFFKTGVSDAANAIDSVQNAVPYQLWYTIGRGPPNVFQPSFQDSNRSRNRTRGRA